MQNKWVTVIVSIICFPIVWTLLDFLYSALISKEAFQFKIIGNLVLPLILGAIFGLSYIRAKAMKKDK